MPLQVIRSDITKLDLDVIVNSANQEAQIGLGVDQAIHKAAGEMLLLARKEIGEIHTGEAYITKGYQLKAKYVIHTVGPIWEKGDFIEENQLASCYQNSLKLAIQYHLKSIAFPLISSGAFKCPKALAFKIACKSIQTFLLDHDINVYLCIFDQSTSLISSETFINLQTYINKNYIEDKTLFNYENKSNKAQNLSLDNGNCHNSYYVPKIELTFHEMLSHFIKRSQLRDIDICNRVYINRKMLSKIRSHTNDQVSKDDVIKLSIALHLNLIESSELLKSLRYCFSKHEIRDLIISYHLYYEIYDMDHINQSLFEFNQKILN